MGGWPQIVSHATWTTLISSTAPDTTLQKPTVRARVAKSTEKPSKVDEIQARNTDWGENKLYVKDRQGHF